MAKKLLVGISEIVLSSDPEEELSAPNLGSCLGIAVYDQRRKCGGMAHCLLPLSKSNPEKAIAKPAMYVDTGTTALLQHFLANGSKKSDLIVSVAGGARIQDSKGVFDIGKKNHIVLRRLLWKNNILIKTEHVGGEDHRTITLDIETGKVTIKVRREILEFEMC